MPPKKKGGKKKKKKGAKEDKGPTTHGISGAEALPPVVPNPKTQAMMFTVSYNVELKLFCFKIVLS